MSRIAAFSLLFLAAAKLVSVPYALPSIRDPPPMAGPKKSGHSTVTSSWRP